ncbi:hypothetical protein AAE478_008667 [Parahypoxylon ruwenzoriense]
MPWWSDPIQIQGEGTTSVIYRIVVDRFSVSQNLDGTPERSSHKSSFQERQAAKKAVELIRKDPTSSTRGEDPKKTNQSRSTELSEEDDEMVRDALNGTGMAIEGHKGQTLAVQGIIWDTIDEIHDGFVSETNVEFENATKFMVALGQCEALAEDATRRYPGLNDRLGVF